MKYLKLFENTYYEEILDTDDPKYLSDINFYGLKKNEKPLISDKEYDDIIEVLPESDGLESTLETSWICIKISELSNSSNKPIYQISIIKTKDDWWYLYLMIDNKINYNPPKTYKCDQIDGVIQLLKDIISKSI